MIGLGYVGLFELIINWFLIVLFLAGFFVLVMCCVTRSARGDNSAKQTPMDIVRERYAKGEATKEQFDQICRDLNLTNKS
jgi:putative membrane protein